MNGPRVIWTLIAIFLATLIAYMSRYWLFRWWDRDGLFGLEWLRPQGGLVGRWLRGSDFAPFELLIWVVGVFLVLTFVQKIYDKLNVPKVPDDPNQVE